MVNDIDHIFLFRLRKLRDQAEHVLFFLTDVLYRMIPPFYASLENALATVARVGGQSLIVCGEMIAVTLAPSTGGRQSGSPGRPSSEGDGRARWGVDIRIVADPR